MLDRRVAVGSFVSVAIGLLLVVALARAPHPAVAVRDPVAARDLVALMQRGERRSWIVAYDFTRTRADGRVLRERMTEAHKGSLRVLTAGSAMSIQLGDRLYECNALGDRSECSPSTVGRSLPPSEVLRVAVSTGAYDVTRQPDQTIGGEPARCFRVLATGHGGLPDLGVETDKCSTVDGVSVGERVVRAPGDVDERRARAVRRRPTTRQVDELILSFDPKLRVPGR